MPTINQLSATTSLTTSDKMVVYSQDNGDSRKATLATLISFLHDNFQEEGLVTQIVVPVANQAIPLSANTQNIWLVLNPAAPLTTGTITVGMPPAATAFDGQEVSISTSQAITNFLVGGGTAAVAGFPTTLPAGAFVTMKYNVTVNTWYATNVGNVSSFGTIQVSTSINDGSNNEVIKISSTPSAINELTISNGAGATGPAIAATSTTTANLDLSLAGKGSGAVEVRDPITGLYWPVVTTQSTQTLAGKTLTGPTINTPTITSPTVTGTATVGAVTLGGNISVDTNNTRKIGTSASNRLLELWSQDVKCANVNAATEVNGQSVVSQTDTVSLLTVKSPLLIGYSTTTNPSGDTVGALTQRNATVACCRYDATASPSLLAKEYNVSSVTNPATGNYQVFLDDGVSTDSAISVTLGNNTITSGKIIYVESAYFTSSTVIDIIIREADLAANTTSLKNVDKFSVIVVGSPATDRVII